MGGSILVTGATGTVGAAVIDALAARGAPVIAALRDPARPGDRLGDGVARRAFDFLRPATFTDAFAGVDRLFLVRPPALADVRRQIAPAIAAAAAAGVGQIVFLSLLGAERNPVVPHAAIERSLRSAGPAWTFLRASFFLQNLSTVHRDDLRERGEIAVPAGRGRTSFIDARDVAEVGALALTEPGHANQAYPLTGGAALDYAEVAAICTEVLGRPIRYTDPTPWAFAAGMRRQGHPWPFILVTLAIYTTARLGLAATVTPDLVRLLGRPPRSVRQFVEDYRASWA